MYSIYSDGNLVYAPTLAKEGYAAISPKLTQELNKSGSLTFTLPPDNEMYDSISKLKSIITVMQDDDEIFRGRELNDEKDFYNRKKKYCEGELAFLLDSIQRPYEFTGDIPDLFKQFISNHNEQVDEEKQFTVGEITVTDANNYINRSDSGYSPTWDAINDKLIDTHGGYIRARLENGVHYIDLVEDYGSISSQVIEFGVNLLDITEYINAEDIFTVLIPLGAESEDDDGNTSRLTITDVNDGLDYIEDETAIALFGRIWKTNEWDDVTLAENLLTKGKAYLEAGIEMAVSLTISAVDLHLIDVDTERIKLGDYVRVVSLPHNLDTYFLCSKIVLDLTNPENSEYTFGVTFTSLTEKQVSSTKAVQSSVSAVQSAVQSAASSASQANNSVQQIITEIPTEYVKTTTFETYKETVSSTYALKTDIPTKVSELQNDSGYLTEHQSLDGYALKTDLPSKVSDLENDAGYVTEDDLTEYAKTDDLIEYVKTTTFEELVKRVEQLEGSGE